MSQLRCGDRADEHIAVAPLYRNGDLADGVMLHRL
jgi:hypothetical protein